MSEENVELVRRGMSDVNHFWSMLDEYVIWDLRRWPTLDLDDVHIGREAVIQGSRHYWGTWDEYHVDADEIIDAGQSVVVMLREHGRGKGSGAPFERLHPQVWTFRDGRIVRWESFEHRSEALEAVGLSE